ncbi:MAG: ribonuclease D [Caulobacterales bacterium]|jgi:ribonuclease D
MRKLSITLDGRNLAVHVHPGDLPEGFAVQGDAVAVDSETLGLSLIRDKLCLVQLTDGHGEVHIVQLDRTRYEAPRLRSLMADRTIEKIFHFARFDVAVMARDLGVVAMPIFCTKIASKLVRTYTDKHGLKDVVKELIGKDLSKEQQSSDWGAATLSDAQLTYAAYDVVYLHAVRDRLKEMLAREGRSELAQACFDFLATRAALDLGGWEDVDIFAHS